MCQPRSSVQLSREAASKLRLLSRKCVELGDLARLDPEPAVARAAGELHHAFEEGRPHVELHLLGDAEPVVEELGQPVAAPRPRFDLEVEPLAVRRAKLDLPGLEMPRERDEAKRARRSARHPDGTVPGARHSHDELVVHPHRSRLAAELLEGGELARRRAVGILHQALHQLLRAQLGSGDPDPVAAVKVRARAVPWPLHVLSVHVVGQRRGRVFVPGPRPLVAMERGRPPEVAPGGEGDPHGPAQGRRHPPGERLSPHRPRIPG